MEWKNNANSRKNTNNDNEKRLLLMNIYSSNLKKKTIPRSTYFKTLNNL
jgi:hypothetical protein